MRFLFLIIFGISSAHAAEQASTSVSGASESWLSGIQMKPAVSLLVGSSSNVGRLKNDSSGAYGKVSPSLTMEALPSESVVLNFLASGEIKRFSEKTAQTLADERNAELRIAGIWFVDETWELGGDLGAYHSESRLPIQISSTETGAQIQKYNEPDARLYLAWVGERLSLEGAGSAKLRRYSTTVEDRGNLFRNDLDVFGFDIKLGYSALESLKISLKALIEDKQYRERRADFSDGAASNPLNPHPTLRETGKELGLGAEYGFAGVKFVSTPGIRLNKDRVFGARDSTVLKLQQKITLPLGKKLIWAPIFTISQEKFDRFRSNPEGNPLGSPLREDLDLRITSPLKYALQENLLLNAEYGFSRKDSNYANSSYTEHAVSAGVTVSM